MNFDFMGHGTPARPLQATLVDMETAQLIRRAGDSGIASELAYIFKHALVQDTAYASLLMNERKRLHRAVGDALAELYPDALDENAARLAQHYAEAGDDPHTVTYSLLAGTAAQRTSALAEAAAHFDRAVNVARRAGLPAQEPYLKRGRVLELRGEYQAALENYREMLAWGEEHSDPPLVLAALIAELTIHSIPSRISNPQRAQLLSAQALALARQLQDPAAEAKILWTLLLFNSRVVPNNEVAVAYGEQGLGIAEANGLEEQRVYLLHDLGGIYADVGKPELAEQYLLAARVRWREWGNLPMLTDNLSYTTMIYLYAGRYDDAIQTSTEAYDLSRAGNNHWGEGFSLAWIGTAYWERGDIEFALNVMEQALTLGEYFIPITVATRGDLARLSGALGAFDRAMALGEQALSAAVEHYAVLELFARAALAQISIYRGELDHARHLLQGAPARIEDDPDPHFGFSRFLTQLELALALHDLPDAVHLASYLVSTLQERQVKQYIPSALRLQGLTLMELGQLDKAAEALTAARSLAATQHAYWTLWQILAASAILETRRGNETRAGEYRVQAKHWIEYIATRTPHALRDSFLQTKRVRNALSAP